MIRKSIFIGISSAVITTAVVGYMVLATNGATNASAKTDVVALTKATERPVVAEPTTTATILSEEPTTTTAPSTTTTQKPTTTTTAKRLTQSQVYKIVAVTSDQDLLAMYDSQYGVQVQGGWTDSPSYFVMHLLDRTQNVDVFVFTSDLKSYDVKVIKGGNWNLSAVGTYHGTQYGLLENFATNQVWLIDGASKSFKEVPAAEVTK